MDRWYTFNADIASVAKEACRLAGGYLSPYQWHHYVGDQRYQAFCPK
jgi:hypothetical protein